VLLRQPNEQLVMDNGERVRRNDQTAARLAPKFGESRFNFVRVANGGCRHLSCD
jgi:hypothetical protein